MKQTYPHLNNAPITEALIDLRIKVEEPVTNESLSAIVEKIKADYPVVNESKAELIKIVAGKGRESKFVGQGVVGYVLRNKENTQVVQIMRDRFTFSRLHPYQDWGQLKDEAQRIWKIYCEVIKPNEVGRIAVRYINRLELPSNFKDFNEYLTASPTVPEKLPQGLLNFLTKVVIPNKELQATAIVHQVMDEIGFDKDGKLPPTVPIILDIDAIKLGNFEPLGESIWKVLEGLRSFKNQIFFESITTDMLELIK